MLVAQQLTATIDGKLMYPVCKSPVMITYKWLLSSNDNPLQNPLDSSLLSLGYQVGKVWSNGIMLLFINKKITEVIMSIYKVVFMTIYVFYYNFWSFHI